MVVVVVYVDLHIFHVNTILKIFVQVTSLRDRQIWYGAPSCGCAHPPQKKAAKPAMVEESAEGRSQKHSKNSSPAKPA